MLREALETLIPELAESLDEKIRKDLIKFVQLYGDNYYSQISKASALSWLERQGEQKSLKIAKFKVGDTLCREGYADHTVTDIYDKCEIPVYICKTDEGESHIEFTDQDEWKLKSHWKPSEEQLSVLQAHLEDGAVVWGENRRVLKTLYEDLKKID